MTKSHQVHYWQISTKVGFCHDGNLPACSDDDVNDEDEEDDDGSAKSVTMHPIRQAN